MFLTVEYIYVIICADSCFAFSKLLWVLVYINNRFCEEEQLFGNEEGDELRVRPATDADNEKLIAIEKLTPQGGQIRLVSERKDYFFRAKKFADPIFLIVEDEAEDMILGIMGVGPVTVRLNNEIRRAGLVFDWRSNPLIKKGLPRHMFRLWQAAHSEIVRKDLDFLFGYVKDDNERSISIITRSGAQVVEGKDFLTMPVHASFCRKRSEVERVTFTIKPEEEQEREAVESSFGYLDLFPDLTQREATREQRERYLYGKFSYRGSSVKVWDTTEEYTQRVLNIPRLFKLARPIFRVGSRVLPLPHIPNLGEEIKVWQLFDLVLDQHEDLNPLLEKVRHAALEKGIYYLVATLGPDDKGYEQLARKAWVRPRYHLFAMPLKDGIPLPKPPTYFDVSYL